MTDRATEDIGLIARFLDSDTAAFDELMAAHEDRVFGICLRMLRDRDAALDAVQETFITVFRKADRYKGEAIFSTWLYRVAVNTCYDQLRKAKRKAAQPLPDTLDPPDPKSADSFDSAELRPQIEDALETLPPEFRAAVVLVDLEGLALETAANMLTVPVGTVKSRVFRGRKLLAKELGNLRPGSEPQKTE
jgi:RNA polymerase sigma-70 factor (ECF subfamily)